MSRARGFSLLEMLVALTIAGLVMAAAVPASARFYASMERRAAVRDVTTLLAAAREAALSSGRSSDVYVKPAARRIWFETREHILPADLVVAVHGSAELNSEDTGVIRFYPDGSSSGGGVDLQNPDGSGTRVAVDWLVGRVSQHPLGTG